MKLFFPEGLCCAECQTLEEEEIYNLKRDPIVSLEINKQRKIIKRETGGQLNLLGSEQPCSLDRPLLDNLCQTTCFVLPGIILRGSEHPPYVELLDQLIGKDFTVTGVRLTVLDGPQAHCISETLSRAKCSVAAKCSLLMDGLCLVLAAQRDDAVICFDSLLDSVCWQKQSVLDTAQHLLYPQNEKQVILKMKTLVSSEILKMKTLVSSEILKMKTLVSSVILKMKTLVSSEILKMKTLVSSEILKMKTLVSSEIARLPQLIGILRWLPWTCL
ncbi:PREDICTED: uncharacterized protein LOC103916900 [Pygoscelis adeliae]|uniref:uncharacterized protein LOC103916900 n=1 Tax=Pygoscelis adeliae TaxID=9238 RepID=UPI0004F4E5BC|nr:PREDICTED: uncharacterized protein LOC103916900 [Pygoscelis adeliae]